MKKLTTLFSLLCLTLALTVPASALDYNIDAPGDPEYSKSTSVEPVVTADRGELPNVDVSKNAALIPPTFGRRPAPVTFPHRMRTQPGPARSFPPVSRMKDLTP